MGWGACLLEVGHDLFGEKFDAAHYLGVGYVGHGHVCHELLQPDGLLKLLQLFDDVFRGAD